MPATTAHRRLAAILADLRIHQLEKMCLDALVRAFLIGTHQTRVARHVGGEDGGKTAGGRHVSGKPTRRKPSLIVLSISARYDG